MRRLLLLLATLATGCGRGEAVTVSPSASGSAVYIGSDALSDEDVRIRAEIIRIKHASYDRARLGACAQLIQGYLLKAVLEAIGEPVTKEELAIEAKRVGRETQAPDLLGRIREACGGEAAPRYRNVYLLPDVANTKFYFRVYPRLPMHTEVRRAAAEELERLRRLERSGEAADLARVGREGPRWQFQSRLFHPKRGWVNTPPEVLTEGIAAVAQGRTDPTAAGLEEDLSSLDEGRLLGRLVEAETAWTLLRWTGWKTYGGERYRAMECLTLSSPPAESWFWERAGRIPVLISDPVLRDEFKRSISWAKHVLLVDGPR